MIQVWKVAIIEKIIEKKISEVYLKLQFDRISKFFSLCVSEWVTKSQFVYNGYVNNVAVWVCMNERENCH